VTKEKRSFLHKMGVADLSTKVFRSSCTANFDRLLITILFYILYRARWIHYKKRKLCFSKIICFQRSWFYFPRYLSNIPTRLTAIMALKSNKRASGRSGVFYAVRA